MTGQCEHTAGCGRPASRRGMCRSHYEGWRVRQHFYGRFTSTREDAEPARQHVLALLDSGVSRRRVAVLAGTSSNVLLALTSGTRGYPPTRTIDRGIAARILAIELPAAVHHIATPGACVPSVGTVRRLQALCAIGYTQSDLLARAGLSSARRGRLFHLGRQASVWASTARAVEALFNELQLTPGPSERSRRRAAELGWAPPLAWDEDTIDDPAATPDAGEPAVGRAPILERYQDLRGIGCSDAEALRALGCGDGAARGLEKAMYRAGLTPTALLKQLAVAEARRTNRRAA